MSNQFIAIPAPAANGAGSQVDMSTYGPIKTITVTGNGSGGVQPFVTIEMSNEPGHSIWAPLGTFRQPGTQSFDVACRYIRAVVSNYQGGGAPTVELGGTDDGVAFGQLVAPAGNGLGSAVNVSGLGAFKTIQVSGAFTGSLQILASEDAGATYQQCASFQQPGIQTFPLLIASRMKVQRNGVPLVQPGSAPAINIAAAVPGGSGGGGTFVMALPNQWGSGVAEAATADLASDFSVASLDQMAMIRGGSVVGINCTFSGGPVSVGTLTLTITINGAPGTLAVVCSSGSNPDGGSAIQATGIDTYAAGDTIGLSYTTSGSFAPAEDGALTGCWIEVVEPLV